MKSNPLNKTLKAKTGKDLFTLMGSKDNGPKQQHLAPASTNTEIALFDIWQSVLGHGRFSIHDDFFHIGGNSLKAVQAVSRICRHFSTQIELTDIFLQPTIAKLALLVEEKSTTNQPAIVPVNPKPDHIPLSFSQERLWFIDQLEGSAQYHIPIVLRLQGDLNKDALSHAVKTVVSRHQALRTVFFELDGQPFQQVKDVKDWKIDCDKRLMFDELEQLQSYIQHTVSQPFDLSRDYMLRANLISLGEKEHLLVVAMHHIASDGWSMSIIVKELLELYRAYTQKSEVNLPALNLQYADYAIWQRNYLKGDTLDTKLSYWKQKLNNVSPLQLPTDYTRPAVWAARGAVEDFHIRKDLHAKLAALSQLQGSTLYMVMLAAFKVLLFRYSGQNDICIGSPVANRSQHEVEDLIGLFVNTLALRTAIDGSLSFVELLQRVKTTTIEAYQNQEVPFEKIVEAVVSERDMSRNPVFQVMFAFQNTPEIPDLKLDELEFSEEKIQKNTSKLDITFSVAETSSGIKGSVEYSTDLYRPATIRRMIDHFIQLLESAVQSPLQKVSDLSVLPEAERKKLLLEFNDTKTEYPADKTIAELFKEQAAKNPEAVAVVFEDQQLTFSELDAHSDRFAHFLIQEGVKEETLVPICTSRSIEMVVAILAVMKTGAAFVPVDPEYPSDRIRYVLEDIKCSLIVITKESRTKLPGIEGIKVIEIDGDWAKTSDNTIASLKPPTSASSLAYVIYTSGSTGRPKGVMIEQTSVVNLLTSIAAKVHFTAASTFLSVTTYSFDICYLELFTPLIYGGRLIVVSREVAMDGFKLLSSVSDYAPTHMQATPSTWQILLDAGWKNEQQTKVLIGGEAVTEVIKDELTAIAEVWNVYGPTETTIWSTIKELKKKEKVLIGKPLSNTSIYILDSEQHLTPIGVAGELCIGGVGLARGYINQPDLTKEKFIFNSFSEGQNSKIYKTGDLSRWLEDGSIEYLGRIDDQVKIRGYRIELGEIESVLLQSGLVKQAVVVAKKDGASKRLVGYVVTEGSFDKAVIKKHLQNKLPEYMVPALWVELESLPLTPNGKIDKKNLPEPDAVELGNKYIAPRNETEAKLAAIWQELLHVNQIGVEDNFFEVGGHSLLAMRVVSAVRKVLEVEVSIKDFFVHSTIAELAVHIKEQKAGSLLPSIQKASHPEYIPLSFGQERLWVIDKLEGSLQYHLPVIFRLAGSLNQKALEHAFQHLLKRHEALRTVFSERNGQLQQIVIDSGDWELKHTFQRHLKQETNQLLQYVDTRVNEPFDLSADYMLRAELIQLDEEEHVVVVVMHHIASDGWSLPIVVKEVVESYNAFTEDRSAQLPSLPIQYTDYAVWQRENLQGEILENKVSYWKDKLRDLEPLQLPTDFQRPAVQSTNGAVVDFEIDAALLENVKKLSRREGATLFMTLLSAFQVLLHRYSNQEDICVGTPVANRNSHEVEALVGYFVNTLALRSLVESESSFTHLLRQVKATTIEAYEHQDVPFEKVVEAVVKERDASRNPVYQVVFVLQNTENISSIDLKGIRLTEERAAQTTSKFELTFTLKESAKGLSGAIEYSTDLFTGETVQSLIEHYTTLLHSIVEVPNQQIGRLKLLGRKEEHKLLSGFNQANIGYPKHKNIVDLFEEQVQKTPDATAVIFEKNKITYEELNCKANQLAHYLVSKGLATETLVPICLDRSIEMIIGILGILKAGGAYVPIDPEYPVERIQYMLDDTKAKIIISNKSGTQKLYDLARLDIVELDGHNYQIDKQPTSDVAKSISPHNLAYIIYTSGSTGKPKGVMIEHRNVVRLFFNDQALYDFNQDDAWSLFHSFSFDFSVWEMYGALFYGGRIIIASKEVTRDIVRFSKLLIDEKVTVLNQTPSSFYVLQDQMLQTTADTSIRYVIFGGEALNVAKLKPWKKAYTNSRLINMYGITETTVHVTYKEIEWNDIDDGRSNIGKPIPTLTAYILDELMQPVPVGISGELYIGGEGVARGYLNRPDLSTQRFIASPFQSQEGARLYRTGDVGRWLPSGEIEYLGRIDDQVKIRGFRIELGEIETVVLQSELAEQAVVLGRSDEGTQQLVAYVVPKKEYTRKALIDYLKSKLPAYMVPALWVELEALPVTSNGKVNKKALPAPERQTGKDFYEAPETPTEEALVSIWQTLLSRESISIRDNFFNSGGDSIKAIRLAGSIKKLLNKDVSIRAVYEQQDLASLAVFIDQQVGEQEKEELEKIRKDIDALKASVIADKALAQCLPNEVEDLYPMSDIEKGMLYHTILDKESALYHDQFLSELVDIDLDFATFKKAFLLLVEKHESLRSAFDFSNLGQPFTIVYPRAHENIFFVDVSSYASVDQKSYIDKCFQQQRKDFFDIARPGLWRIFIFKLNDRRFATLWVLHHAIMDGWSLASLQTELSQVYFQLKENSSFRPEKLKASYKDYIVEQTRIKQNKDSKEFWKKYLDNYTRTALRFSKAMNPDIKKEFKSAVFSIEESLIEEIDALSKELQIHHKDIFLAGFTYLLKAINSSVEVTIGLVSNGRPAIEDSDKLIGCFLNTVPFRHHFREGQIVEEFLKDISQNNRLLKSFDKLPFSDIVEIIKEPRDIGNPVFDIFFNYIDFHILNERHKSVLLGNSIATGVANSNTYLDVTVSRFSDNYTISINYLSSLFAGHDIERLVGYYKNILSFFTAGKTAPLSKVSLLTQAEEQQLLVDFNNTKADYPKDKSIVDLFEAQASKTPDATAIVFEEEQLSYATLNERSNQLARYLRGKGVQAETLVPICIERSAQMLVGILGILKAGGAYVPIDPEYPLERIQYMLEDTAASLVVSSKQSSSKLGVAQGVKVIEIDTESAQIGKRPKSNLQTSIAPDQLAYIIYTSGSTGKPKGVMIEHSNVYSFICWCHNEFSNSRFNIAYLSTSICFDLSIYEIFYPLTAGKKVRIVENGLHIGRYLSTDKEVLTNSVPVVIENLLKEGTDLSNISVMNMAGEPIPLHVQQGLDTERIEVRNLYGPTEDTTYSTIYKVAKDEPILIGRPIANTSIYIVGKEGELVPVGIAGEICIGGSGLARGYLNRPELTAEKFIQNPFSKEEGSRLYRTGDLGRWLADGNIEYLGRIDTQVKIRGYRIELGEIESVLMQSGLVSQAVVIAKADKEGNKRLVGYVVTEGTLDKQAITGYLQDKLPGFMVPALWVQLESLPLTPNGKIDKKALPDVDASEINRDHYVAPRNETEEKLAEIWQDVLNIERIGVEDNFFELGGHSVLVIRLVSAIRHELQVEVSLKEIFDHPTINTLTEAINRKGNTVLLPTIAAHPHPGFIPLSFSQERLLFIHQLYGSEQYHIPAVLRLQGRINTTALASAFRQLIKRHSILRTVYHQQNGHSYQAIGTEQAWQMSMVDCSSIAGVELQEHIEAEINRPFDLSTDYMLRATLLGLNMDESVLVVTMHHIASDGWSLSVMVKEVSELYAANEKEREARLSPLAVQHADYAIWQKSYLTGDVLKSKIEYWKDKLHDVTPLQLPADFNRPPVQSTKGAAVNFEIEKNLLAELKTLSLGNGSSLFMTLLTAFKVLLHRYTGQQDICVGTVVANRTQREVEGLIGFFVNTLAIRTEVGANMTFTVLMQQVTQTTMEAFEHQEAPFEKVVEAVVKERDASRTPLFQVMFALNNTPAIPAVDLGGVQVFPVEPKHTTSQFDLSFNITQTETGLQCVVEYCTDLFSERTARSIITHFKELLYSLVRNPNQKIGLLPMLTGAEQGGLMIDFNKTEFAYNRDEHLVVQIEKQALLSPHATALITGSEVISYNDLNEKANQLGRYLKDRGIKKGSIVPVYMRRSIDIIVSMLAIIKTGAAYVPIDPGYPAERVNYIIADCEADLLIASIEAKSGLSVNEGVQVIDLSVEDSVIGAEAKTNLHTTIDPHQLAYVIYTSGSTGKPKGVMIEHLGLTNLISWHLSEYQVSSNTRATAMAGVGFDAFTWEVWPYLAAGASITIVDDETRLSLTAMTSLFIRDQITHSFISTALVPSFLKASSKMGSLKYLLTGGDKLPAVDVSGLTFKLVNNYGPTENTVVTTNYWLTGKEKNSTPPIGKPIGNTNVYIINPCGVLQPVGVIGEICISGDGLARGYLHMQELTKKKFIKNPFSPKEGSRLYRTGDLGRWLPDGNIEYHGRLDEQVKINGYRIELEEIENVLLQSGLVTQAVVIAKEDKEGNKRLVGYAVTEGTLDKQAITTYLQQQLPGFMVPALWVSLESLPLTPNGKIDKKALPNVDASEINRDEYVAPRNQTEQKLAEIWQELLHVEKIGIHDNFFEIGGHSLLAMRLIALVKTELQIDVAIKDLFQFTTISELAKYIEVRSNINKQENVESEFDLLEI